MKLKPIHIFFLLSLVCSPFSDSNALACGNHEMVADALGSQHFAALDMEMHAHMNHDMATNQSMSNQHQATEVSMSCCDDCKCQYSNCHNSLMLAIESIGFDWFGFNELDVAELTFHHKNLPSHPYRPPIG